MTNEEREELERIISQYKWCSLPKDARDVLKHLEKRIRKDCENIAREIAEEHSKAVFDSYRSGQASGALSVAIAIAIENSIPKDETK